MPKAQTQKTPKILLFDIETMANKAYVWGKYEQNVLSFDSEWYILTFAYKWLGDSKTEAYALPDFKTFRRNKQNDRELCLKLWELLDEADIVIGHNCLEFDIKKANARFAYHGLTPPSPYKVVDTRQIARRYFKFNSNKLDDLGQHLGLGAKVKHSGWEMWLGAAVHNDKKSWEEMVRYNKVDVDLLEKVYLTLLPWITTHPNYNLYTGSIHTCPNCGGKHLQKRGFHLTRVTKHQRYQCQDCGAWSHAPHNKIVR